LLAQIGVKFHLLLFRDLPQADPEVNEDTLRLAYDANLYQVVTVRATFDQARRRGAFVLVTF